MIAKQLREEIFTKEFLFEIIKNPLSVFQYSFFRYLVIGFSSFGLDFSILYILTHFSPLSEIPSNYISTFVTIVYNFNLSNYWTFKSGSSNKKRKAGRFLTLSFFNYIFSNFAFMLLFNILHFNLLIIKVIVTGLVVCWNFLLYKFWVFKNN
jgi:putative flippase GtrA